MKRSLFLMILGSFMLSSSLWAMDRVSDSGSDSSSDSGSSVETENPYLFHGFYPKCDPAVSCHLCGQLVHNKCHCITPCCHCFHADCIAPLLRLSVQSEVPFKCPGCEKLPTSPYKNRYTRPCIAAEVVDNFGYGVPSKENPARVPIAPVIANSPRKENPVKLGLKARFAAFFARSHTVKPSQPRDEHGKKKLWSLSGHGDLATPLLAYPPSK